MAHRRPNAADHFDERAALMKEIGEFQLLSQEEERELLVCKDDREVREKLICHNLRLVSSIVKRYQNVSDLSFADLFQLGTEGLIHAIDLYDIAYQTKLSTYATKVIKGYIVRGLQKSSGVHISDEVSRGVWDVTQCETYLTQQLGCFPTAEQVAQELGISLEELEKRKNIQELLKPLSLSHPHAEDQTLGDTIEDETDLDRDLELEKLREDMRATLDRLNPRERHILILHYGINAEESMSQEKIAEQLGVSKQRIQQIEKGAMKKLRALLEDEQI